MSKDSINWVSNEVFLNMTWHQSVGIKFVKLVSYSKLEYETNFRISNLHENISQFNLTIELVESLIPEVMVGVTKTLTVAAMMEIWEYIR